jgi:queuine/archaeosine tRNA-ribosyltransferase
MPCPCSFCRHITYNSITEELQYDGKKITKDFWNGSRREHNLFAMNNLMEMINRAIREKQIELVREKIKDSEISNLKTLIPQHYESD